MNKIENYIKSKENKSFLFTPCPEFYQAININRKRWGLIYRGEIEPTIAEAKAIANYFSIEVTEII